MLHIEVMGVEKQAGILRSGCNSGLATDSYVALYLFSDKHK